jgi:hypothetical protein
MTSSFEHKGFNKRQQIKPMRIQKASNVEKQSQSKPQNPDNISDCCKERAKCQDGIAQ